MVTFTQLGTVVRIDRWHHSGLHQPIFVGSEYVSTRKAVRMRRAIR